MRIPVIAALLGVLLGPGQATTLQQLSLDDMIRKSSEVVRGTVVCTGSQLRGSTVYTNYTVRISEQWKGSSGTQLDFSVPGGIAGGIRQTYAGTPSLVDGQEFVLFLWTGKSGLRQLIGLSQGLFTVAPDATGQLTVSRTASPEPMLDATGKLVSDSAFTMPVSDLRTRVASTLSATVK